MTMKATELMIGDWVSLRGGTPIRVENVHGDCINFQRDIPFVQEEFMIDFTEIVPIPLTAEILKKNGFKHSITEEDSNNFDYTEGNLGYVFNKTEYGYMSCIDVTGSFTISGLIKYVHELQHALHLCGMNELANFKI